MVPRGRRVTVIGNNPAALSGARIPAALDKANAIVIRDPEMVQNPDRVATILVEAESPPTMLVVEQRDLESYFLELVGMKEAAK